jgi:CubicO group peptidase (beta-lactamase class C family)
VERGGLSGTIPLSVERGAGRGRFGVVRSPLGAARLPGRFPIRLLVLGGAALVSVWAVSPALAQVGEPVGRPAAEAPEVDLDAAARAGPASPARLLPAVAALERQLMEDLDSDGVGSVVAAVVLGDRVVWTAALGEADRETARPASPSTLYRAGSITKTVTALALLALVERGVLALDDPVDPHLPELVHLANRPPDAPPITFRHLASHTAGVAREPATSFAGRGPVAAWRDRLRAALPATEVVGRPGQAYLYSNVGYALLGLAMERAAGQPFETLVHELVLDPLGMHDTGFSLPAGGGDRVATGYVTVAPDSVDPRVPRAEHRGRGYRVAADGLYTTAGDLTRLAMALTGALGDVPVTAASRRLALTDHSPRGSAASTDGPEPGLPAGYGLGLQLHRIGPTLVAGHSGTVAGYASFLALDPAAGAAIILLRNTNQGATNLGATAVRVLLALRDGTLTDGL